MTDLSKLTALVFDHGLFVPVARRLAQSFGRVLYHSPWEEGFSSLNKAVIGDGFGDIDRCNDIWSVKDEVDLFVFPDVHHAGLQLELEKQGKAVWGSRNGDVLELNREKFLGLLENLKLDVPPYETAVGIHDLRRLLIDMEDCYIKVSKYRGSFETAHWRNWSLDSGLIDHWAAELGPAGEQIPFIVCPAIATELEIGGDTFCVDGEWPSLMLHGIERKDKAYLAAVTPTLKMPEEITSVMDAFGPVLKEYRYRNQWSMEVRVTKDKAYFIDATCRGGLPSTASQMNLWSNWPEIVWSGANGELVEPEPSNAFSAEVAIELKGEKGGWRTLDSTDSGGLYLTACCEVDGVVCFPPNPYCGDQIGWLQAQADTPSETLELIKKRAEQLPDGVTACVDALVDVIKEIETAKEDGIEFSHLPLPEPESVVS